MAILHPFIIPIKNIALNDYNFLFCRNKFLISKPEKATASFVQQLSYNIILDKE